MARLPDWWRTNSWLRKYFQRGNSGPIFWQSARAGIRTRVGGMKTHYDGPGYTTRADVLPTNLLLITVGYVRARQVYHFGNPERLDVSLLEYSLQTDHSERLARSIQDLPLAGIQPQYHPF